MEYEIGDLIRISGYHNEIFEIVGYHYVVVVRQHERTTKRQYQVKKVNGETILHANESVMRSLSNSIDGWLDLYLDYLSLYELFQDDHYKKLATSVLSQLKKTKSVER
jgi:hypothetical protein